MFPNALIVHWTVNDYNGLKRQLAGTGFVLAPDTGSENLRVEVPYPRVHAFVTICQPHLNAPYNYIDIQFPTEKTTVLVFQEQVFTIQDAEENARVRAWAVAQGLPPEQADWGTSF